MATPKFNSKSPTIRRILKEAAELSNSPSPEYTASPVESDLFEWHFTMRGPPKSAFAEGIYHGRIVLPPSYPLSPPSFRFSTPSGRFEPNREICLSISGHHEETWQPAWGVRTAIVALRTFMETGANGQIGGLDTSDAVRRRLATESQAWRCAACARTNADIIAECEERCRELDGAGDGDARQEVEVPAELRMGFRDEMEKKAEQAGGAGSGGEKGDGEEDVESAQLAEGFVQTAPETAEEPSPPPPQAIPNPIAGAAPPAQPAQGVPAPTGRAPAPDPVGQQALVEVSTRAHLNTGVPAWIDYAIVSLVIMLLAMILKIMTEP